ncbi:hypothetical protein B9J77_00560 [candidate division NPL-UPA2 bacterium Unc8]|uniref:Uncharacterized protein n=1 Tax=candidate division NPL-UPA2 bacterium Unc8 TaxID=1980939 RepID=A0A399FXX1_UNCN2|nr:MAG: hypothetical protein B9J77_00560 [candidate division NPL-UPA2 bacterium Unc8]
MNSNVNRELTRIYFELHGFLTQLNEHFFVFRPKPAKADSRLDFILCSADIPAIERATINVKGWHTDKFFPSRFSRSPEIFDFVQPEALAVAGKFFGGGDFKKILVLSSIPAPGEMRGKSIELLSSKGVDHIIEFATMLNYIIGKVKSNQNYVNSDLLQLLRLLKRYQFIKDSQLDLF